MLWQEQTKVSRVLLPQPARLAAWVSAHQEEHNAEVTGPDPDTIADSGSNDSDSDTDGQSDKTTCYKCLPRGRTADVPLSAAATTEANDADQGQPMAMTN